MKNWSIRNRILFLALLPGVLVSLILGIFFISGRSSDLQDLLSQRALAMAKQLAPTCEYGVMTGSVGILQNIANSMLEERDVRAVNLYDQEMNILAHAGPRMIANRIGSTVVKDSQLQLVYTDGSVRVKAPIFAQNLIIADQLSDQFYAQPRSPEEEKLLGWAEIELSSTNTRLAQYQHIASSLSIISIVLLLCLILALRISRTVGEPVKDILRTLDDIRAGRLESRVHIHEGAELQALASGVNAMASALQRANIEYQQNIEQANRENQETIDELEIRNHELTLGRKQALEASRMKSEFLANVSHEIRTPLNGIIGFSELLERTQISERQGDYLQTIRRSSEDLLNIINDILDLSKIDAGKLIIENSGFNLRDVVEEALQVLAPEAASRGISLIQCISPDIPGQLCGDRLRLKQILTNLINNAVKFTPEGSVTVRVYPIRRESSSIQLQFDVCDTGIGMTPEQQDRLFQAFSQADASIARQYGGTGLGLIISKALVETMKGEIRVISSEGEGSTFSFTIHANIESGNNENLPALEDLSVALIEDQADWAEDTAGLLAYWQCQYQRFDSAVEFFSHCTNHPDQRPECLILSLDRSEVGAQYLEDWFTLCSDMEIAVVPIIRNGKDGDEAGLPEPSLTLHRPFTQHRLLTHLQSATGRTVQSETVSEETRLQTPPTILAVDDNEANLKLVVTLLQELGVDVLAASSGYEAVAIVSREQVDLVLMDIQMPGMSGTEATACIRDIPGKSTLPVVALTAHAMADERQVLIQVGMNDYQTKPVSQAQLARIIERWTGYTAPAETPVTIAHPGKDVGQNVIFSTRQALHHANQNMGLAVDMFGMLLDNMQDDKEKILTLWEMESLDELLEAVHRLHGATRYCGVPALRIALDKFETLLKANKATEFPQALRAVIGQIDALAQWAQDNDWEALLQEDSTANA
ncbi:ATP-binding protein [Thalassolituus sp.]|uniref:ATP-binding protein n=1 Tax=Thalassolituus sp. TaxID=2030822 RepID=UPI0035156EB7